MNLPLLWHLGRLLSWPHWAAHAGRTVLTSIGVALGVATVVGIADVSRSVLTAFQGMVDAVAGEADLEVASPVGDLEETIVEPIRAVNGVKAATGIVEQFVSLSDTPESSLYVLGIDFLGSNLWRRQFPRDAIDIEDDLAFLARTDSVVVPVRFLQQRGARVGDRLTIVTPNGVSTLTVRGTIGDAPAAKLFGGALAVMDLPAAQRTLGREGRVDRVGVKLDTDADPTQLTDAIRRAIAESTTPGIASVLDIVPPEARGQQAAQLLFSLRTTLAIMSLGALIVGAFIVYHTIAISVAQRRREFALLNASGVSRVVVTRLCVLETVCLAVPGALIGVLVGHVLAMVASGIVGATASEIWVQIDIDKTELSTLGWMIAGAMGLSTAVAASYAAIRATFAAPTIETLRPAGLACDKRSAVAAPLAVAAFCAAAAWIVCLVPAGGGFVATVAAVITTQALGYVAVAIAAAPIVAVAGWLAGRYVAQRLPVPAALAAENLPRQPGRSGGTVATIAATIAIAVTVAVLVKSHDTMALGWIEQNFGADLFVGRGERVRLMPSAPMPADMGKRIENLPEVEAVEVFRTIPIRLGEQPAFLQGIDVSERLRRGGLPMVDGSLEQAARSLVAGSGVLLSQNLAFKLGLARGDTIALPSPDGAREFVIEGLYTDYLGSLDLGAVAVEQRLLETLWKDRSANLLRVWLRPNTNRSQTRRVILSRLSSSSGVGQVFVLEAGEFVESIRAVIRQFFAATWALQLVAALVGVIGVVNTQLAIVLDRSAEIGVLRAIGLSQRDIVRSVVIECGVLGSLGGTLGVVLGLVLGAQIVLVSLKLVTGWSMTFHVPWEQLGAAILIATVVSALAGYVPARAAARIRLGQTSTD